MSTVAINVACNEFGRAFTPGQIVNDLPPLYDVALVQSGLARYLDDAPVMGLPTEGLVPITSVQFADPVRFYLHVFPQRTYIFNEYRWIASGTSLVAIGAGNEATVLVTPSEVLALNGTPKVILQAPPVSDRRIPATSESA